MILLLSSLVLAASPAPCPATATVVSVYDGDTVTLSTGDRVRLRFANTPELKPAEPLGLEARDATRALVEGKVVNIQCGTVTRDGYGRLLASLSVDGQDLALNLLSKGLAHLYLIPPQEVEVSNLVAAQEQARSAHLGIWAVEPFTGTVHITSFHANADGDDKSNVNGEYFRLCNMTAAPLDLAGYRITDISGNSWELPAITLPPGYTVKVHTGKGVNQLNPVAQQEIYLQNADPIWNNADDRVTVYDRYGKVVDTRGHLVESKSGPSGG